MLDNDGHLSDEELILAADDELSVTRRLAVRAHLSACWTCRARMQEMQQTIADVVRAHREELDEQPVNHTRMRAKLHVRLCEVPTELPGASAARLFRSFSGQWSYAFALAILLFASVWILRHLSGTLPNWIAGPAQFASLPNPHLTPGAVRPVTIAEVCSLPREEVVRSVPDGLQAEVFREYGLRSPKRQDYEVDYLITPGLGGADQIGNLWPEPYSGMWNAHLKDLLEERLHEMVCDKQITLESAQREIATDWIAAYKKYVPATRSAASQDRPMCFSPSIIELLFRCDVEGVTLTKKQSTRMATPQRRVPRSLPVVAANPFPRALEGRPIVAQHGSAGNALPFRGSEL